MSNQPTDLAARDRAITTALERWFGFAELRPMQREAIDAALDGQDALVVLPTGGGKSLCYQLPALVSDRLTVVVSPLIALMQDQVDGLRLQGVPAAAAHSNLNAEARAELRRMATERELRVLFVAPERLFQDEFLRWLGGQDLATIAIDEAHCISQWGHDFRTEYRRLSELRDRFPDVTFHAYTATATPRVRRDILTQLRLREPRELIGTFDRPELCYRVLPRQNLVRQVAEAIARHPDSAAIVYCISRKDTESLAAELRSGGIDARAYHAGLAAGERTEISSDFRLERLAVVVATVAFGMGIDRSDVRLVVHAAMPKSLEHYQQETGRAGRDGLAAECLLLYSAADAAKWRTIMRRRDDDAGGDPAALQAQIDLLQHMQRFAGRARCRHRTLSEYFGQQYEPADCGACDVCLGELEEVPGGDVIAQKILSAVVRTGQRFGSGYVIDVLRGSRNEKVLQRGHEELSTFGLCADLTAVRLGNYIDQLIDLDVLERSDGEYPIVRLGGEGPAVLSGELSVVLRTPKAALDSGRGRSRRRAGAAAVQSVELEPAEAELFEAMRGLRRAIAGDLGVPPYVVFSDATLVELARIRPSSASGLLEIRGVGQKKVESFGQQFLAAIAAHCATAGLELDTPPTVVITPIVTVEPESRPRVSQSVARTKAEELFAAGAAIDDVASEVGRAASTVVQYLAEWVRRERPASIEPWVAPELEEAVAAALTNSEDGRLKPIHAALEGRVPYDTIRLVAAHRSEDASAAEPGD